MKKLMLLLITISMVVIPVLPQSGDVPEKPSWTGFNLAGENTLNDVLPGFNNPGFTTAEPAGLDLGNIKVLSPIPEDYDITREEYNRRMKRAKSNIFIGGLLSISGPILGTFATLTIQDIWMCDTGKGVLIGLSGAVALGLTIWGISKLYRGTKTIKKLKRKYSGYIGFITDPKRQTYGISVNIAF